MNASAHASNLARRRITGEVLLAKPFLRRVDWAKSIGGDGKPVVIDPHGVIALVEDLDGNVVGLHEPPTG